jgi:hypothetical protein
MDNPRPYDPLWCTLVGDDYQPGDSSRLIDCSPAKLAETFEWRR